MISSQSRVQYREGYEPSDNYADEVHFSPDLDPMEPSFEAHPRGTSGNKRSLGRELLRLVVYGLAIITVSGAAFASNTATTEQFKRSDFEKSRQRAFARPRHEAT